MIMNVYNSLENASDLVSSGRVEFHSVYYPVLTTAGGRGCLRTLYPSCLQLITSYWIKSIYGKINKCLHLSNDVWWPHQAELEVGGRCIYFPIHASMFNKLPLTVWGVGTSTACMTRMRRLMTARLCEPLRPQSLLSTCIEQRGGAKLSWSLRVDIPHEPSWNKQNPSVFRWERCGWSQ